MQRDRQHNIPSPEYGNPWRSINWREDRNNFLSIVNRLQPVNTLRILLHGPVGAGKSSFFNSVNNALQGRITNRAPANSSSDAEKTFTLECKTYKVKDTAIHGSYFPFTFTDIAGMHHGGVGIQTDDIIKLLSGHVKDGYTFNPVKPITQEDPKYNRNPTLKDKIHCLVAVLPANSVSIMDENIIRQMKVIREKARYLGIPQVIIMTKVDETCPLVKDNLEKIYKSKKIKQKIEECSLKIGVPVNRIYPVKNYHEERDTKATVNTLILDALQNIVTFANDYVEDQPDNLYGQNDLPSPEFDNSRSFSDLRKPGRQHTLPSPEYGSPWRSINWREDRDNFLRTVNSLQPENPQVNTLRILLHGPVGAGKSSFFNSVNNALRGRITNRALANSSADAEKTFTLKCKTYRVKNTSGSYFPFTFTDIAGMHHGGVGIQTDDIIKLLSGHVKDGYTFNPVKPITQEDLNYNRNPTLKDRIHCLVAVLPANTVSMMEDVTLKQMKVVREKARDFGIPQVIIITKVDETCPLVKDNLEKIYTSKKIKQKIEECSLKLGVPVNCIYPVRNYHEERATDAKMDTVILDALQIIANFANDHVEDQTDD